jgi:hypothetical protein
MIKKFRKRENRLRQNACSSEWRPVLPDFSWCSVSKLRKNTKKSTKNQNDHRVYQMLKNIPNVQNTYQNFQLQGLLPKSIKMGFLV